MPIHDWTRVSAGTFGDFHLAWIAELRRSLNAGLLPDGYYALAEQVAGDVIPDVLTLQDMGGAGGSGKDMRSQDDRDGGVAVADSPSRVALSGTITEATLLASRQRRLVIRHTAGDRIVAILEIVSLGNKERVGALEAFVDKVVGALDGRYHLLVIDLFPPGPCDPRGIHGAVWERLKGSYEPPAGKPLTQAAYRAAGAVTCYVGPTAVGLQLVLMPLFLTRAMYLTCRWSKLIWRGMRAFRGAGSG